MDQLDLVSIVIPVFNGEEHIRPALETISCQTYNNLQIIIDDGSTDTTASICTSWCEDHDNVEYYHQENLGISAALNRGLTLARGKYIARMDADDLAFPTRISEQVTFLAHNKDVDVVSTGYTPFNEFGQKLQPVIHPADSRLVALLLCYCSPVCHPAVLARKEVFDQFRYNDKSVAEDHNLWCRIAEVYRISNIEKELLYYRRHNNSLSQRKINQIRFETLKSGGLFFFRHYGYLSNIGYKYCIENLSRCKTLKLWPALVVLTLAKVLSFIYLRRTDAYRRL